MVTIKLPVPEHDSVLAHIREFDINFIKSSDPNDFYYNGALKEFDKVKDLVNKSNYFPIVNRDYNFYINISGFENDSAAFPALNFIDNELPFSDALEIVLYKMFVDGIEQKLYPQHIIDLNNKKMSDALKSIEKLGIGLDSSIILDSTYIFGDDGIEFMTGVTISEYNKHFYEYLLYPFISPAEGNAFINIPHYGRKYEGPEKAVKNVFHFFTQNCDIDELSVYKKIKYCFSALLKADLADEDIFALDCRFLNDGQYYSKALWEELVPLFGCKFFKVASSPNGVFTANDFIVGKETAVLILRFLMANLSLMDEDIDIIREGLSEFKAEWQDKKDKIDICTGSAVIRALYEKTVFPFNM